MAENIKNCPNCGVTMNFRLGEFHCPSCGQQAAPPPPPPEAGHPTFGQIKPSSISKTSMAPPPRFEGTGRVLGEVAPKGSAKPTYIPPPPGGGMSNAPSDLNPERGFASEEEPAKRGCLGRGAALLLILLGIVVAGRLYGMVNAEWRTSGSAAITASGECK